ncbi:helicase required for RNAi-mediated heterochromatin assembly 1 [Aspergillus lentulus]|uniref:Helicase required for RNAi-mediated heterochromatin assembly 1 n=1 Tax=Aspergillus lentulus TaxID=293939 RepID=A0ABQ1ART1_ASPLE|nr:helicase required for RNAi-mediated heterochromatin assembly 1 [Aspergillus lentulus]GFF45258.1 helicase required for RNAi-mediated heterochromatin assembly 1 [Aspergillus lentulus]GFF69172.1 helicase required for RNAi-mediated heterochromatin assembly 1 [Aspergillus lentulus]GFF86929.1 helicase required for RNAi-mediated heterochromatin assembly 1 [Aspergillus lentulus]GFG09061.1 helicase required for RNAi-mediated heterochromatin assembly 1 [Aspergillus lentulus]
MDSEDEPVTYSSGGLHETLTELSISPNSEANLAIREYCLKQDHGEEDPWLQKPEIPTPEEILPSSSDEECVELMPNRIDGPWSSKDSYLRAHYELLREDAVAPLRDAVAYVRNDPHMADSQAVSIYEKVYMTGITFAQTGIAFRIRFSTNRSGKKIVWEYSKRLIAGSIVALSPASDSFRSKCVIAVVAARPLEGVKQEPPEVDIFFAQPEDANFDPHEEWIMVEARTGYYEAMRHTMTALQRLNRERFPLADHICGLNPDVDAPDYVKESPNVDIESVIGCTDEEKKINLLEGWPESPTGDLDKSQRAALKQILTKKLAIIQGPPGTGKTHVSVIALKILLSNMHPHDPPIVVSSQTNHALDQLLRHISVFEKDYIRLGGRSSDPEIKKRTLFSIRQNEPAITVQGGMYGPSMRKYKTLVTTIVEMLEAFSQEDDGTPLSSKLFAKHGLLSAEQCDSLAKGAKGWVRPGAEEDSDPLIAWLGDQVVKFQVTYMNENFGFDENEVDLEYEQLKELEAEQGIEEDDYENLRGQFIFLREAMCGLVPSNVPEADSLDQLRHSDMWKVPLKARGAVYDALRSQLKMMLLEQFRKLVAAYTKNCEDLRIGKWERDHLILRKAKIIGMTATGLSKYRALISSVKPKTILIEEAAEVIEAPIAVACLDSVQHMILVGDHQQLKGHCAVQDLEGEPFHLDVSMFERLVKNGIGYVTLRRQRRMVPEIRRLLEPIYGELRDHQSVLRRPKVPGMADVRSFFFSHSWPESSDSLASKYNVMEAEMIVGFFVYLVLNGVSVDNITVLTFYNGQRKKILKLMRNHSYLQGQYVKVVTVDSYQGEENDIVILSLVRSSNAKGIGFLSVPNRVCVALSRARNGLYIFGNAQLLYSADDLWRKVITIMANERPCRSIGFQLPLTCQKHGNTTLNQEVEPANVAGAAIDDRPKVSTEEELKKQAIRGYQEFAQWGAKQQDILLLRKANPRSLATMQRENQNVILTSNSSSTRHKKGKKKASAVSAKKAGIPKAVPEGTLLDD